MDPLVADKETIRIYERVAREWTEARTAGDLDHVGWVEANRAPGALVDIGCGPGWHLADAVPPAIALDPTMSMLRLAADNAPAALGVRAVAEALPFATGSLGGALANRVYLHLPLADVPLALADLHRCLAPDGVAFVCVVGDEFGEEFRARGRFGGRLFSGWSDQRLADVCHGAGFTVEDLTTRRRDDRPRRLELRLRRGFSLADTVGSGMRLLVCGLNPSIYSAEVGIGFGRPGNRFWPAAIEAGLVTEDRDPRHALSAHGIGMTDLVKRPTRRADELSADEYRQGLRRVERLVEWLKPAGICFVGLAGWRAAVERKALAGLQADRLGGAPVYLMPSTSGLNAATRLADLVAHLKVAAALAG